MTTDTTFKNPHLNGDAPAIFDDPRNITIGNGRVIWAPATKTSHGRLLPAGWVLPGGARTNDMQRARDAAALINT